MGSETSFVINEIFVRDLDLAVRWKIARGSVWRWQKEKKGFPPPVKFGEGTTRWRLSDIERWEAEIACAGK